MKFLCKFFPEKRPHDNDLYIERARYNKKLEIKAATIGDNGLSNLATPIITTPATVESAAVPASAAVPDPHLLNPINEQMHEYQLELSQGIPLDSQKSLLQNLVPNQYDRERLTQDLKNCIDLSSDSIENQAKKLLLYIFENDPKITLKAGIAPQPVCACPYTGALRRDYDIDIFLSSHKEVGDINLTHELLTYIYNMANTNGYSTRASKIYKSRYITRGGMTDSTMGDTSYVQVLIAGKIQAVDFISKFFSIDIRPI